MAEIKAKVLTVIDRLYRFTGQKVSVDRADLAAPIQFVHDVSRQAELGSGVGLFGGYAVQVYPVTHAGPGTQYYVIDPYYLLLNGANPLDPEKTYRAEDLDIWLVSFQVWTSLATQPATEIAFGLATDSIRPDATAGAPAYPVCFFTQVGVDYQRLSNYAGAGAAILLTQEEPPHLPLTRLPFRYPHGSRVTVISIATAVSQQEVHALVWVGARGTTPPGMR